jgi:hypothetical protein
MRGQVLDAASAESKARAYSEWFQMMGPGRLADLVTDADTGIALQASWEIYKKPVKRPMPIEGRTNDVYDRDGLGKFLAFLKHRTKAPVPDWWAEGIVDVDLFPGEHHVFTLSGKSSGPKLTEAKAGGDVPEGAELERRDGTFVYTAGGRAVRFPTSTFADVHFANFGGVVQEKRSFIAAYPAAGGFAFNVASFEGEGDRPAWKAEVWAAGRTILLGLGHHWVELKEKGGTVFVFGGESHGMYMEAFEAATGRCEFRFCTSYWFNFSEKWRLK